jgi:poly(hydroxyalkanoate) depolymerase family esterase
VPRLPVLAVPRPPTVRRSPGRWVRSRAAQPGGRSYDVYLPAGYRRRTRAPLVLLLHGCTQTPAEFADATRFTTVADRNGFLLVLPHQESRHHPQGCWRWYEAAHQHRGAGEPALLAAIVAQVLAEPERWRADPRRVFVAGLSAGGAMALILAATYPDVVAGVGVHSAPPYRSATRGVQALSAMAARTTAPGPAGSESMPPLIVLQGSSDRVVHPPNGDRVADQWLAFRGAEDPADPGRVTRSRGDTGRTADGRDWTRVRWYTARGRRVLEYWVVDGLGHAWSGGRAGGSFSDPAGPRAATIMWAFFRAQRLDRAEPGRRAAGA